VQQGKRLPEADFQVQMLLLILHVLDVHLKVLMIFFHSEFPQKSVPVGFCQSHESSKTCFGEVRVALPVIPTRVETAATPASLVSQRRESVKTEVKPFKQIKDEGAEGAEGTKTLEMQVMQ
jgi:hypothetical protein